MGAESTGLCISGFPAPVHASSEFYTMWSIGGFRNLEAWNCDIHSIEKDSEYGDRLGGHMQIKSENTKKNILKCSASDLG
jgi:hypothetical protein